MSSLDENFNAVPGTRITLTNRLAPPSADGPFLHTVEARQVSRVGLPKASDALKLILGRMIETIFMGIKARFQTASMLEPVYKGSYDLSSTQQNRYARF
ncbi:hypothetical protein [Spirochaeta dissipatitropha]